MTDYSGLVKRLLQSAPDMEPNYEWLIAKAADALEAQRERIERLEGALRIIEDAAPEGMYSLLDLVAWCRETARAALEAKS